MKKTLVLFLVMAMLVSCLAGCSQPADTAPSAAPVAQATEAPAAGDTDATPSAEAAFTGTIKFGLACPLTGNMASYGELMQLGAQIAADELNAKGGIKGQRVEIVAYDDKQDPKEAALVAQRFCDNEEIFAVISHGGSSMTLAAAPIYEAAKLSNMAPSSSNGKITEQGYEYFVRHVIRDDRQSPQCVSLMANNLGLKKIAIIYGNSDYGRGNLDYATKAAEQLGVQIVAAETYNPGLEKDFATLLTKIQKSGAEGVALYADYTDAGLILGQAYQLGMDNLTWVGQSALTYKKLIELAGAEALQNLYILVTFNPYDTGRPAVANFMNIFQGIRPGEIPSEPCAFSYDIVNVFAQAIEAGATKENLAMYIKNNVPGQTPFVATNILLGDEVVWDSKGDVTPRGVEVLKVSPEGDFVNTDIKVDITGLQMAGVVE
jgi:branched-chain amino acid transport system substrate-binding protein